MAGVPWRAAVEQHRDPRPVLLAVGFWVCGCVSARREALRQGWALGGGERPAGPLGPVPPSLAVSRIL